MLSSTSIRRWLNSKTYRSRAREDPGVSPNEASRLWESLKQGRPVATVMDQALETHGEHAVPDLAMTLSEVVAADVPYNERELTLASEVWLWLARVGWPSNEFDEQKSVLADLAFTLATGYRKAQIYKSMRVWEEKCSVLYGETEPGRSYLAAFATKASASVDDRVLSEPGLLLAFCRQQEAWRNVDPSSVLRRATQAFTLVQQRITSSMDNLAYFAADLAMSVAVSSSHFRSSDSAAWVQAAEYYYKIDSTCHWLSPIPRSIRITLLSSAMEFAVLLKEAPGITRELEALGADRQGMSVRLCQAQALKAQGQFDRAAEILEDVITRYSECDSSRLGMAYAQLADVKLEAGDMSAALGYCEKAYPILRGAPIAVGIPYLQAVVGQLYRFMGCTDEAVSALRASADGYLDGELKSWAANARILAAETLLLAERATEALEELLVALVLLQGTDAAQELRAAVKLLSAAVVAAKPRDPRFAGCREALEQIRKGHL